MVHARVSSDEGVVCGCSTVTAQPWVPPSQRPFLSARQAASCSEPFSFASLTTLLPLEGRATVWTVP